MKSLKYVLLATATAGLLAGCGTSEPDRAEGGAATGAATGAVIGAIFGGVGAIPGALIGGAIGAGTGAATTPQQVDLGQPVWDRNRSDVANAGGSPRATSPTMGSSGASSATSVALAGDDVRDAQRKLQAEGFYKGPIDGLSGPATRQAVLAYQRKRGMPQSGQLDQTTLASLDSGRTGPAMANTNPATGGGSLALATGGDQVRDAQRRLQAQGYYHGAIDGRFGPQTRDAVTAYQRHNGLKDTAQLDADTLGRLNSTAENSYGSSGPNRNTGTNQ